MTLVAAFKHRGTPVLIGDMALAQGKLRSLRKKVYVISPNLVVAWAGHMIVAKVVVSELRRNFGNKLATKEAVELFFKSKSAAEFGSLHTNFIGWIIEKDNDYCFLWNCLYPNEVFYKEYYVDGTGEQYFTDLLNDKWEGGESGLPREDSLVLSTINQIAKARFDETLYRETWDLSFGSSYDVVLFLDGRFKYIGSIVYIGWDYHWDPVRGSGRLEQVPVLIKHNSYGEFSILQEAIHGNMYDGKMLNYLSRPVFENMPEADLSSFGLDISTSSDYFANYFLFRNEGKVIFKTLLTIQQPTDPGPLRIKLRSDGAYFFDFDTNVLDQIYQRHVINDC